MKQPPEGDMCDDGGQAASVTPNPEQTILFKKKKLNLRQALSPDLTLILPPKAGGG